MWTDTRFQLIVIMVLGFTFSIMAFATFYLFVYDEVKLLRRRLRSALARIKALENTAAESDLVTRIE